MCVALYLHSAIRLHDVVLNYAPGITSPFHHKSQPLVPNLNEFNPGHILNLSIEVLYTPFQSYSFLKQC
jgi:hypothetical protein